VSSSIEYISIMPYLTATPQDIPLKIRCERWDTKWLQVFI